MCEAIQKLLRSFRYASRGICVAVRSQRNMRIHLVAAAAVLLLSFYFELSKVEYAILILTVAAVPAAELLNTSIELLADEQSTEYSPRIRDLKDAAAGAVFVLALGAVAVGVLLFGDLQRLHALAALVLSNPLHLLLLLAAAAGAWWFIFLWPPGQNTKESNDNGGK